MLFVMHCEMCQAAIHNEMQCNFLALLQAAIVNNFRPKMCQMLRYVDANAFSMLVLFNL